MSYEGTLRMGTIRRVGDHYEPAPARMGPTKHAIRAARKAARAEANGPSHAAREKARAEKRARRNEAKTARRRNRGKA